MAIAATKAPDCSGAAPATVARDPRAQTLGAAEGGLAEGRCRDAVEPAGDPALIGAA